MEPYYDDGQCVIYHGDALSVLASLDDRSVDLVMTDPPYSSGGMVRGDRIQRTTDKYHAGDEAAFSGDNRDQHAHAYWVALWMSECRRLMRESEVFGIFTDWRQLTATIDAVQAAGMIYRGVVVWDKTDAARGYPGRFAAQAEFMVWASNGPRGDKYDYALRGVYRYPAPRGSDRVHLTQKPVDLFRDLLRIAPPGGVVLDPFMGSGTTLRAAVDLGLKAIGADLDERNCEIAARRLDQGVLNFSA